MVHFLIFDYDHIDTVAVSLEILTLPQAPAVCRLCRQACHQGEYK